MQEKELIIANLRKQLGDLNNLGEKVKKIKSDIRSIIEELADESHLGSPSEYDFGSSLYKKTIKTMLSDIKTGAKILSGIASKIEAVQVTKTKIASAKNVDMPEK